MVATSALVSLVIGKNAYSKLHTFYFSLLT